MDVFNVDLRYRVFLGRHDKTSGGTEYSVKAVLVHPKRDKALIKNDLAILTLTTDIKYTSSIQPICLPSGSQRAATNDRVGDTLNYNN